MENNIEMDIYETGWEDVEWIPLAYDRGQAERCCQKRVIKFRDPYTGLGGWGGRFLC